MISPLVHWLVLWDKVSRSLVLALRSLWLHKLRAFLSVLGIIIATAAVITLMGVGEGSMHEALEDIKRQGATNVMIRSLKPPDEGSTQKLSRILAYGLTYADYEKFQMIDSVVQSVPMRIFQQKIRRLHYEINGRVVGTTAHYEKVNQFNVAAGRFLVDADNDEDEGDDSRMRNVCVLGADVARDLFPFEKAVGQSVVINKHQYVVAGVLGERMAASAVGGTSTSGEDYNSDVYIPLRTCRGRFGERLFLRSSGSFSGEQVELHQITLTISEMGKVRDAGAAVRDLLETHHLKKDWAVTVPLDRLEEAERARDRYTRLLVWIALISLVVGGIGIMNIMLATVTERTREIGIRRALGAKRRDIIWQFLIEAVAQTTMGGLVGVGVGLGIIFVAPLLLAEPARFHKYSIYFSLGPSVVVGVLAGLYPAFRASRLDPIEALRHE